jgi:DNA-directed RNA polymerase specialized sigma24 family protein
VDRDAFQTLYDKHHPLVSNLAFKMLGTLKRIVRI